MRIFGFILAVAVGLIGPSFAGETQAGLPGIGTFSYHGAPVVTDAPAALVVALR